MSDIAKTFGARVRAERERQEINQAVLADHAGVSPTTMSSIELGKTDTNLGIIEAIARTLGKSPLELLAPEGQPTEKPLNPAAALSVVSEAVAWASKYRGIPEHILDALVRSKGLQFAIEPLIEGYTLEHEKTAIRKATNSATKKQSQG